MAGAAIKDKTVVVTGANRGLGLEARQAILLQLLAPCFYHACTMIGFSLPHPQQQIRGLPCLQTESYLESAAFTLQPVKPTVLQSCRENMLHSVLQWVKQLVSKGNKVIASCRNPSEAADLRKAGVAHIVKLDVSDPASIQVLLLSVYSIHAHLLLTLLWHASSTCTNLNCQPNAAKCSQMLASTSCEVATHICDTLYFF